MDYKYVVDLLVAVIGLAISFFSCLYTYKTFVRSSKILNTLDEERRYEWNRKELDTLFSTVPIGCIDSFFDSPDSIRDELWKGLSAVDLNTFQYDGKEKETIVKFIEELDNFRFLNYKQTPSHHWKFVVFSEKESYDGEKERLKIKELQAKASSLKPKFQVIKNLLLRYHVDKRELDRKAYNFYSKKIEDMNTIV